MARRDFSAHSIRFTDGWSHWLKLGALTLLIALLTATGLAAWQYHQDKQSAEEHISLLLSISEQPATDFLNTSSSNKAWGNLVDLTGTTGQLTIAVYDANGKYINGYRSKRINSVSVSALPQDVVNLTRFAQPSANFLSALRQFVNLQAQTVKPYRLTGFAQIFRYEHRDFIEAYSPIVTGNQLNGILYATVPRLTPDFLGVLLPILSGIFLSMLALALCSYLIAHSYWLAATARLTNKLTDAYSEKIPVPAIKPQGLNNLLTIFNQLIEDVNDRNRLLSFHPQSLNNALQQDVTQLKVLTQQNQELQTLSSQALAAQQEAETANRMKSEFIATISHEIRTPMNAVLGIADTLWQDNLNADQRHSIQIMKQSSALLLNLLNDMTDFSKIESGELALSKHEFNCAKLIQENFQLLELDAKAKGLKYVLEIESELPYMLIGDASRLSQILINLLSNAIKFTAQGEVRLTVSAQKTNPTTLRLHCEATDTGIGIGALQLDALFDALSKDESAMTRIFPGSGLGLAITKRLVQLMQGKIGVHSQPGIGSTFWFWLDFEISKTQAKPAKTQNNYRFNASLLVAEDYPANQLVVQRFLEDLGCRVQLVNNGFDAIKAIKKQHYDLVFMDCQMPFMDGYQATREIRILELANNPGRRIPIIALTAHALSEDETKCKNAGMDEWVTKPFTRHDLSKILLKWLPKELIVNNQPVLKTDAQTLAKASSVLDETHAINMKFFTRQFKLDNIDDVTFINALTSAFRENAAKTLSSLQHSIDNADAEAVRKEAHGLKSLSVNVGSGRLTELCAIMEKSGKNNELSQAQELLDSMKQEYLRVLSELASLCTKV